MLTDQVILITGCSTGIGRALAQEAAHLGHRVFATARNPNSLTDLRSERLTALPLDVTNPDSIAAAVDAVLQSEGRIDVLINNAGLNLIGPVPEVPIESVRQIFDTNVVGLVAVTQAVFPPMARAGRGRIINIGSVVGMLATPYAGPYCASKAAVHALTESLRMEAAPFGIEVVEVQPGGVRSQIAATGSKDLDRYRDPSSLFHPFVDGIEKRAGASQQSPMETEAFAKAVLAQTLLDTPPRIVRAGRGSRALPAASRLPGQLRDRIIAPQFGLTKIRAKRPS